MRAQLYQATAFLAILTASGALASATPPRLLSIRDDAEIIPAYVHVSSLEGPSEDSSLIGLSRRDLPLAFRGLGTRDVLKELDSRQICPTGTSLCQDGCCPSGYSCNKCGIWDCGLVGHKCCREEFYCAASDQCHTTRVGCCKSTTEICDSSCCPSGYECHPDNETNGECCPATYTGCSGSGCCPPGYICIGNNRCRRGSITDDPEPLTTTTTSSTESSSESSSTTTSETSSTSTTSTTTTTTTSTTTTTTSPTPTIVVNTPTNINNDTDINFTINNPTPTADPESGATMYGASHLGVNALMAAVGFVVEFL